jgi:hypothetical protein
MIKDFGSNTVEWLLSGLDGQLPNRNGDVRGGVNYLTSAIAAEMTSLDSPPDFITTKIDGAKRTKLPTISYREQTLKMNDYTEQIKTITQNATN